MVTLTAVVACGCQPPGPTSRPSGSATAASRPADALVQAEPTSQPVIAIVNGKTITKAQLEAPLIESYGLTFLLNLVQLELATQEADTAKVAVTPADIDAERDNTLRTMFKDSAKSDWDNLLDQFLQRQRITRPEFDMVISTNAYLRKIALPKLHLTDENLQEGFRALYGETVEVRDIELANMQEVATLRARLAGGETFEKLAADMSRDGRTKGLGGLLPPFSRQMTNLSEAFKSAAFALREPGEVSDPIQTGTSFHLLQLVRKNAPKAVKFEDVRESVRTELSERWMQNQLREMHRELARTAMQTMDIRDPTLRKQYEARMTKQAADTRQQDDARRVGELQRRTLQEQQGLPGATPPSATAPAQ